MTQKFKILKKEALDLLQNELPLVYTYHSYEHTSNMLSLVDKYVEPYDINSSQIELLKIAILYHDLGFIEDYRDHELRGAKMAEEAMLKLDYSKNNIDLVKRLIMATKIPQEPQLTLEKIICDIDLDYLGRKDYFERSELLFQEWLALGLVKTRSEWEDMEKEFLTNHQFHSKFGILERQSVLNEHIAKILSR